MFAGCLAIAEAVHHSLSCHWEFVIALLVTVAACAKWQCFQPSIIQLCTCRRQQSAACCCACGHPLSQCRCAQEAVKASLPRSHSAAKKPREDTTWLPRDIPPPAAAVATDDQSLLHQHSGLGTPVSERNSMGAAAHTGYSSEGSNADMASSSRPGTPASYTQVCCTTEHQHLDEYQAKVTN